jgi:hypothetical protein
VSVQEVQATESTCLQLLTRALLSLFAERVADSICVDAIDRRNVPRCSLPSFGRRDLLALAASSLFWRFGGLAAVDQPSGCELYVIIFCFVDVDAPLRCCCFLVYLYDLLASRGNRLLCFDLINFLITFTLSES